MCGANPLSKCAGAGAVVMAPILGVQCFLARTALGWSVSDLGRAAEMSYHTVERFERGGSMRPSTVETIQRTLEKAGVIFIGRTGRAAARGVKKKKPRRSGAESWGRPDGVSTRCHGSRSTCKQPDREPMRPQYLLRAPVRTAGQDFERAALLAAQRGDRFRLPATVLPRIPRTRPTGEGINTGKTR
jgi:transcriptional regulator with XRE-family HTH domain